MSFEFRPLERGVSRLGDADRQGQRLDQVTTAEAPALDPEISGRLAAVRSACTEAVRIEDGWNVLQHGAVLTVSIAFEKVRRACIQFLRLEADRAAAIASLTHVLRNEFRISEARIGHLLE